MGSEIQAGVMRAQKHEIRVSCVTYLLPIDQKFYISCEKVYF
jgi:hypothetical protein